MYSELVLEAEECFGKITSVTRNMWFKKYRATMKGHYVYPSAGARWAIAGIFFLCTLLLFPVLFIVAKASFDIADMFSVPRHPYAIILYAALAYGLYIVSYRYVYLPLVYKWLLAKHIIKKVTA